MTSYLKNRMCCPKSVIFFYIPKGEKFLFPLSQKEQKEHVSAKSTQNHQVHKGLSKVHKNVQRQPFTRPWWWLSYQLLPFSTRGRPHLLVTPTPLSRRSWHNRKFGASSWPFHHGKELSEPLQRDAKNTPVAGMGRIPPFSPASLLLWQVSPS